MGTIMSVRKQRQRDTFNKAHAIRAFAGSNCDINSKADDSNNSTKMSGQNALKSNGDPQVPKVTVECAEENQSSCVLPICGSSIKSKTRIESVAPIVYSKKSFSSVTPELLKQEAESISSSVGRMNAQKFENERNAAICIQRHVRGYQARKKLAQKREAAIKIQRTLRGHQVRRDLEKRKESAVTIQKHVRGHLTRKKTNHKLNELKALATQNGENKHSSLKSCMDSPSPRSSVREVTIGAQTKESFESLQDDINDLRWLAEKSAELAVMSNGKFRPQTFLLVASNVPKCNLLNSILMPDTTCIVYDFAKETFDGLIQVISSKLENYRPGSKISHLGFLCQGSPGCAYLLHGKACTKKKLGSDTEMQSFFQKLGVFMSKLDPDNTFVDILGSEAGKGNDGDQLLHKVQKAMLPSKVNVRAAADCLPNSLHVLGIYVNISKYKIWKNARYSKTNLLLP